MSARTPGSRSVGFAIAGGAFYPVSRFIGVPDLANGNAAFGSVSVSVSGSPADVLAAADGALLVLARGGIVRVSAP